MNKKNKYTQELKNINSLEELNIFKEEFLNECEIRAKKISVSNILNQIDNFCSAKTIFESMIIPLMKKNEGKKLINKYIKTIKENKSIKTIYAYYEGINNNKKPEDKRTYIVEALSITKPIHYNEYVKGVGDIIKIIVESFKLLGDEFVLNNIEINEKNKQINESLIYLSTTQKNIKNLNEYHSHINNLTNEIHETTNVININSTLEEIISEMKKNVNDFNIKNILETDNKEKTFKENKQICLEMIEKQKKINTDIDVISKLDEIESKLSKKEYVYETYTKDMLYMSDLQEILK